MDKEPDRHFPKKDYEYEKVLTSLISREMQIKNLNGITSEDCYNG